MSVILNKTRGLSQFTGHIALFGASAMWGLLSPVAKLLLSAGVFTPLAVNDLRLLGAMMLFWIASLFSPREKVPFSDLLRLFLASQLVIVINQGCFLWGLSMSSPVDASIISTAVPLLALILGVIFFNEILTGRKILGIAFGAGGAVLLILGGHSQSPLVDGDNHALMGNLLVVLAETGYASYLVFYKDFLKKYSLVTIMKWMFTFGFITLLFFSWKDLLQTHWSNLNWKLWLELGYLIVFGTFVSYMLLVVGQKRVEPVVAGVYNYFQPLVAALVAVAWGLDSFNGIKVAAVGLVFAGVYLVSSSGVLETLAEKRSRVPVR